MQRYLVTGQDLNEIHSELAGNGRQNGVTVADIYLEHCIGQVVGNDTLNLNYVVFCQVKYPPMALLCLNKPSLFVIRC